MKPYIPQEAFPDLQFPVNGLDTSSGFSDQRAGTTCDANNVRSAESITKRIRGGSRSGLSKYVLDIIPQEAVIQHLAVIVDPQADALGVNFEDPEINEAAGDDDFYQDDPSSNNLKIRNTGKRVRIGGSGYQQNINLPRRTPNIIWNNPADITQGTALSGTQLNATAADPFSGLAIAGSFEYSPSSGTILPVGNGRTLSTRFTPNDRTQYKTANKNVVINVTDSGLEETHIAVVGDLDAIAHQTLAASGISVADWQGQDESNNPVAGTITIDDPDLDTVPTEEGDLEYMVSFAPTDTMTYAPSTLTGNIFVEAAALTAIGHSDADQGQDGEGHYILSVQVDGTIVSNLADPSNFVEVGQTVTAYWSEGSDDPGPILDPGVVINVGLTYDFDLETFFYQWQGS